MRPIAGFTDRLGDRLGFGLALGLVGLGLVASSRDGHVASARADEPQPGGNTEIQFKYAGFDPEQFLASADPDQIGLMDGATTQTMGTYAVGMLFHFAGPPLDICVRDGSDPAAGCKVLGDVLNSRLRADLGVLYGLGRFDIRLTLPMVLHQSTDFQPAMGQSGLSSAGIGNPHISGRVQLANPGDIHLAADLGISIPTGQANFIGDEGVIVDPRLLVDWRHGSLGLGLDLGYRYRQDAAKVANLYVDDEIIWSVAGEYQLKPGKVSAGLAAYGRMGLMNPKLDLAEQMHVLSKLGPEEFPAELLGSAHYYLTPQLGFDLGLGTALTKGYGTADYRVIAGLRLAAQKTEAHGEARRRSGDRDHDGVADEDDQCPKVAEDLDGFQDTDGCAELDNDDDGMPDTADKCPLAAEDKDGFEDGDGCPDYDNDGDGVADDDDKCPDQAEDMDGFQDDDGCPDLDTDQDGVADDADQCPDEAGDADHHGCVIHDTDGDNLSDDADQCPDDPETVNEVQDDDGCPDAVLEVGFDKARIRSASTKALGALAASLKARGNVKVRIEGRTAGVDLSMNQQRADAVVKLLIKEGVAAGRLEAKGFLPSDGIDGIVFVIKGDKPAGDTGHVTPPAPPTPPTPPAPPAPPAVRDHDGDGIPDATDKCVGVVGDAAHDGCPPVPGRVTPPPPTPPTPVVTPPAPPAPPTPVTPPKPVAPPTPVAPPPPVADAGADADNDGVADDADKCPADAETMNQVQDDDGCPDAVMEVVFDTARVRHASFPALDALAASLKSRGVKVRIEGHTKDTDEAGNAKRADSVLKYLVKKGVSASKLEAQGFAPSGDVSGMIFVITGK